MSRLERTAHPEAAPAVADYDNGVTIINDVTVEPSSDQLGACRSVGLWESNEELWGHLVSLLAGYAAEIRMAPDHEQEARMGAGSDFEKAGQLISKFFPSDSLEEWQDRAAAYVDEHWTAIGAVAGDLIENGTVPGDEVEMLIDEARGLPGAAGGVARLRALKSYEDPD